MYFKGDTIKNYDFRIIIMKMLDKHYCIKKIRGNDTKTSPYLLNLYSGMITPLSNL